MAVAVETPRSRWRDALSYLPVAGPWLLLAVLVIIAASLSGSFLRPNNLLNILRQASPLAVVAMGQTLVILIGGIDVSVGAVVSLTTVIGGSVMANNDAMILPTVLACLLVGLIVGVFHYLLIVRVGTDPFVTTLGSMLVLEGLNLIYTGGAPRSSVTDLFRKLAQGEIVGVPIVIPVVVVVAIVLIVALRRTTWGRRLYAVGGNAPAARMSGYPRRADQGFRVHLVFAARGRRRTHPAREDRDRRDGGRAGVGARLHRRRPDRRDRLRRGQGRCLGHIAGVLILTVLFNIFNLLAISTFAQLIIKGIVIIVGISLYSRRRP